MDALLKLWRRRVSASEFEALVQPHIHHLYRLAYRFTGSVADAEDLVQDVLTKLLARSRELRSIDQPRPWLTRVLYHQFVDDVRALAREPASPPESEADPSAQEHPPAGEGATPEGALEHEFTVARLQAALGRLSEAQRAVLALHDMEGYTLPELSTMLELPIGTLKSRLHRARAALRAQLGAGGEGGMEPSAASERVIGER
ncbi:MAG: RNA polymerase sigma factor [Gammaproteobacteria bacterium]|nr:RNA polymerase sigma factor [Gammaproteobacteria bacterium]NIR85317.1 RNA polymerase sigma factor [Gammaproteobacteria bacterium]NIR88433.1 RNA polymerase sigma factor [Gammaproteobacteria bacterium]NIU06383.1 RNA polymerase sigma factor [Gammaproteobacteria bacterium]NIV53282.1 sigma-70 family RNA polymerase sigma factor [Gammaproteobacteria bacterium]